MVEKQVYKVLVIEAQDDLRTRMEGLLKEKAFLVHGFDRAEKGLDALKAQGDSPFALIISNYAMPEMKGDEILLKARELSSASLRILLADASDIDTVAKAVNNAQIHSCLTLPLDETNFMAQVENCCRQYQNTLKLNNLNQVTQRQNRQLFQIASNFKKQEIAELAQMEERKKQIRILESKLKAANKTAPHVKTPSLEKILESRQVEFSAQGLGTAFQKIKDQIKQILETAALGQAIEITPLTYQEIFFRSSRKKESPFIVEDLIANLMPVIKTLLFQSQEQGMNLFGNDFKQYLDNHLQLALSPDRAKAFLQIKKMDEKLLDLTYIKYFLFWHKITYGIKEDRAITSWLLSTSENTKPFVIAQGKEPVSPRDAVITYHFSTDFRHAGKVNEDGTINFRDRGEIPFVSQDTLLAAKGLPQRGLSGIDVLGHEIPVREPCDMAFEPGPGTCVSEDGNKIYAQIDGQPHLDVMGKISVWPELKIQGDLGFETGNIVFDGNVVVEGIVKSGFTVKGASLTAREVEGAQIDLTGDLNVSLGIVDAELINVKGSVQAKYIHNSKINAFGDLIVQREIMDSVIRLSGACINTNGVIIASEISANMGVDAGTIGTETSHPPKLQVGKDRHTHILVTKVEEKIKTHAETIAQWEKLILDLEKEDFTLHGEIAKQAHVQDRAQLELKSLEAKKEKASGNMADLQKLNQAAEQLKLDANQAEERINAWFKRQDKIALEISQKQDQISEFEFLSLGLADEKKWLLEFTARKEPQAQVRVAKKILAGTQVFGQNSSLILKEDHGRCQIKETKKAGEDSLGMAFYEMKITGY